MKPLLSNLLLGACCDFTDVWASKTGMHQNKSVVNDNFRPHKVAFMRVDSEFGRFRELANCKSVTVCQVDEQFERLPQNPVSSVDDGRLRESRFAQLE
jgi:hypothetical protein